MARRTTKSTVAGEGRIVDIDVGEEMRSSFLEYAYSVIYARALPDARDGLKPVQRRILFQMAQMGLRPDRGHVKSARVVGEVMGRLHPHGDTAIYDALVRMAQPFTLRLPMVDGHGNFGSLDDGPAAMRYTEARLSTAALDMTLGLDEDVVDFGPNYDGRETEPSVLPSAIPHLLVNGASGIAVGMATTLVPHNLGEVIGACRHLIDHPEAGLDDIMRFIPGPDLAGGGVIVGLTGITDAYETGRGTFKVRARTRIDHVSQRRSGIIVSELPMSVGPERVIERIKDLVQSKKLVGIADIIDLTDGDSGLRLVIEIKNGFNPEAVLENLFRLTPLEESVNINAVALVAGQPQTMGLLAMLNVFLDHRFEVVRRRSEYRRRKAHDRLHLVAGLLVAIIDIDEVISLIRDSDDAGSAKSRLITVFDLSEVQAVYILDMPLRRLTKFSRIELEKESDALRGAIGDLDEILGDDGRLREVVSRELGDIAQAHANPRRTLLLEAASNPVATSLSMEIDDEPTMVLMSSTGLLARTRESIFDYSSDISRSHHDVIMSATPGRSRGQLGVVTNRGRVVRISVLDLPSLPAVIGFPALSAGAPIGSLVNLSKGEHALCLTTLDETGGIALATSRGVVKRVIPDSLSNKDSWEVIKLEEGDEVIGAVRLDEGMAESAEMILITSDANLLRFTANAVRPQGRTATGMAGIRVSAHSQVIFFTALVPTSSSVVVTIAGSSASLAGTDAGTVKVTPLVEYPAKGRGTVGVRCHKFRSGEDHLRVAWAGNGPVRGATTSGVPVDIPDSFGKRDGTGTPGQVPISGLGGRW